ncbi:MAG TPA: hypothetical protein VHB45_13955 [Alloacidobacterium sp.]|nr:hypothetical protein [Alloacidobacterium sp.]
MKTEFGFAHRQNEDGTFDSICLNCFRTITTEGKETNLAGKEKEHHCNQTDLQFSSQQQPGSVLPRNKER